MASVDLRALKDRDEAFKPKDADDEWVLAANYYEDAGRDKTRARLDHLKVGLKNNTRPLEVSLLRRIIDRLAVTYDKSPTRWLRKNNRRLAESNEQHQLMLAALERAQYDLVWRRIDRLRALLGQVAVRFYASDPRGSVVLRVFEPFNILRDPDPTAPDQMDMDRRFALRIAGDSSRSDDGSEVWEHWRREGDTWFRSIVDHTGEMTEPEAASPYSQLPVMMVYDDIPAGRAWLPPRQSRTAWVEAINAMSNDLWNLIVNQAHSDRFFLTDDTNNVPTQKGPGLAAALPKDTQVIDSTPQPKITESRDVLETLVRLWSLSEDLPATEFDRSKQVVTGATLKVQEKPLLARRQAQVPLAREDERQAWKKFRAVHNIHSGSGGTPMASWDLGVLDEDTSLEVEIPDVHQPVDPRELHDHMARAIALGSASMIDLIMREQELPRARAIEWYERVQQDNVDYPPRADPAAMQEGPKLAGVEEEKEPTVPSPSTQREEMRGKPSVIQAVKNG